MGDLKQIFKRHEIKKKLTWEINDFRYLYDNSENTNAILSEECFVFSDTDPEEFLFKWYFQLYPKGIEDCENALSLYLHIEDLRLPFVIVNSLINLKFSESGYETKNVSKEFIHTYDNDEHCWGFEKFLEENYIAGIMYPLTRRIILQADITFCYYQKSLSTTEDSDSESNDNSINSSDNQMSLDISVYLNKDLLSDVTISAGDQKYFAHKVILSARSSVFAAMFVHDFKENNENLVTVDESSTVFYQILEYMYSNKLPTKETVSEELFAAAHKYGLDEFQEKCQRLLETSITVENVLKRLKCADLHNIDQLKKKSMSFIKNNFKDIIDSKEWSELLQDNVKLVNEVLHFVHS